MIAKWDVIISGLPITTDRGFIGYSSVSLISIDNHLGLFDTGPEGIREKLIKTLKDMNIQLSEIEFIILSHLHFDHSINCELFPSAKIYTTKDELEYAISEEPELHNDFNYVKSFIKFMYNKFILVKPGEKIYEGEIISLPGHTKGSIGYILNDCIFTGDALKYAKEAIFGETPYSYFDNNLANESIKKILKANKIIVPGHDPAFSFSNGKVNYLSQSSIEIYKRIESNVNVTLKDI